MAQAEFLRPNLSISQSANAMPAARMLQISANHRAQSQHDCDESQCIAKSRLDRFQDSRRRHSGGHAQRKRGKHHREERMHAEDEYQNQQQRHCAEDE